MHQYEIIFEGMFALLLKHYLKFDPKTKGGAFKAFKFCLQKMTNNRSVTL